MSRRYPMTSVKAGRGATCGLAREGRRKDADPHRHRQMTAPESTPEQGHEGTDALSTRFSDEPDTTVAVRMESVMFSIEVLSDRAIRSLREEGDTFLEYDAGAFVAAAEELHQLAREMQYRHDVPEIGGGDGE